MFQIYDLCMSLFICNEIGIFCFSACNHLTVDKSRSNLLSSVMFREVLKREVLVRFFKVNGASILVRVCYNDMMKRNIWHKQKIICECVEFFCCLKLNLENDIASDLCNYFPFSVPQFSVTCMNPQKKK